MRTFLLITILSLSVTSAQSDRSEIKLVTPSRPGTTPSNTCDDCFEHYRSYCRVYDKNGAHVTDNPFAMNGHNGNIIIKGVEIKEPAFFTATNWSSSNLNYVNEERYIYAGMEDAFKLQDKDESYYKCIIKGGDIYDINADIGDVDFRVNTNNSLDGEIRLLPGFHAEAGSQFHAYIKPKMVELERYKHDFTSNNSTPAHLIEIRRRWNANTFVFNTDGWNFTPTQDVFIDNHTQKTMYQVFSKEPIHSSNEPFGRYESIVKMCTKMGIRVSPWFMQNSGGLQQIEYDVPELNVHLTRPSGSNGSELLNCQNDNSIPQNQTSVCPPCRNHFLLGYAKWFDATTDKEKTILGWWGGKNGAVFPVYDPTTNDPMSIDPLGKSFRLYSLEILRDEIRYLIDDCVVARLPALNKMNSRNYNETVNHSRGVPYWIIYGAEPLMGHEKRCYFNTDSEGNATTTVKQLRAFDISPW